jgi:hypothetical protein
MDQVTVTLLYLNLNPAVCFSKWRGDDVLIPGEQIEPRKADTDVQITKATQITYDAESHRGSCDNEVLKDI